MHMIDSWERVSKHIVHVPFMWSNELGSTYDVIFSLSFSFLFIFIFLFDYPLF